jgi:hypothetical protein
VRRLEQIEEAGGERLADTVELPGEGREIEDAAV